MSTPQFFPGVPIEKQKLIDLWVPEDGTIDVIYGHIGNGKTYAATADILSRLRRGEVVYCNWRIDFKGVDQRDNLLAILGSILGLKRNFYRFNPGNLHYIELDDAFIESFEKLTDCAVYLDEGHVIFDSYQHAKFSLRKRASILHTRHFNRSIVIVSQRPTAVHVSARANVNRFYKCEALIRWPFTIFRKTEYQDMVNESVDEEKPTRSKYYFASRRIFKAYNSKYLRGGIEKRSDVDFDGFTMPYWSRWGLLFRYIYKNTPSIDFSYWKKARAL